MAELIQQITGEVSQAEKSFIGCVVIAPDFVRDECGWLDPAIFSNEKLGEFWGRVLEGTDPAVVAQSMGLFSEVYGYSNLTPAFQQAPQFANAIAEGNYFRQAVLGAQDIVRAASQFNRTEIEAVVEVMTSLGGAQSAMERDPDDVAERLIAKIKSGNTSVKFGITSVDWATGGAERGTCTVLAGRTSMGKTALALEFAEAQALQQGKRVAFFAAEMKAEQLVMRRVCHKVKNLQGLPATWQDVRNENIGESEKIALYELIRSYTSRMKGKLDIIDKTNLTTSDVVRIQAKRKYDVVFIDHLGLLKDQPRKGERWDQLLGRMAMSLHDLAKNTDAVVIVLHQLNREVGQRTGNRPTLTDLRDSGKIEENVDNVILMHRDSYWDPTVAKDVDPMELILAKFRDGSRSSTCFVGFDLRQQKFVSMTQQDIDALSEEIMQDPTQQSFIGEVNAPF